MQVNLESLGITEDVIINLVLSETGLTKEQAIEKLAERLGVDLSTGPIETGRMVNTSQGPAAANVLTQQEQETLKQASLILGRVLS